MKVERIGPVTIYKRGLSYSLYYREDNASRRTRVDGNLAVARATASKVASALAERRPSPIGHERTSPEQMVAGYLDAITNVQRLALRTQGRYRAALQRFLDFCKDAGVATIDAVDERTIEDFVRWLSGRTRTRNGSVAGKKVPYKVGGIKFILSTCLTAFNWAGRRRMLPPFAENPLRTFPIDKLRDRDGEDERVHVFAPAQEEAFFSACSEWQAGFFTVLATYGLRVGELTHLLVEDVDFEAGSVTIRSKPELLWTVKTGRRRVLPLIARTRELFGRLIGDRKAGFVFLNEGYAAKAGKAEAAASPRAFRARLQRVVADLLATTPDATESDKLRAVRTFCRSMGQIPERRLRGELMKLTEAIGCPEFTRAHDLRHLFSSRAQEAGMNPLMVQDLLGHSTLDMTRRYRHIGLDWKRIAMNRLGGRGGPRRRRSHGTASTIRRARRFRRRPTTGTARLATDEWRSCRFRDGPIWQPPLALARHIGGEGQEARDLRDNRPARPDGHGHRKACFRASN